MTRVLFAFLLALSTSEAAVHYIRSGATNSANFQLEVTTSTSPQDFIAQFDSPTAFHVEWGDSTTNDFNASITNTHSYASAGVYTIKMSGHVHHISLFVYPGLGTPALVTGIKSPIYGIDGMTSAYEMFKGCVNVPSVPSGLFSMCPSITTFYDTFINVSQPTSMPDNLFSAQTNVTTFYAVCDNMDALRNIPSGWFDKHTNVNNMAWAFAKCYALTNVPTGLFDKNTNVTTFGNVFYRCFALQSIPPMLFANNTNVTTYVNAFYSCTNLVGTSPTNAAGLKLWELTPEPTGTECFHDCTNLTDYADIPADWK